MGFHTFDPARAERLEDPERFRFCSREELLQYLPRGPSVRVLDIGSGTGFYTDELAPFLGRVVGLDLQPAMHDQYHDRGLPGNVELVTGNAESLPFAEQTLDGAFSTMTFHETATDASVAEVHRILTPGGRLVIVDWSANGDGESGPPLTERYDVTQARKRLSEAGLDIIHATERSETFHLVAERPAGKDRED